MKTIAVARGVGFLSNSRVFRNRSDGALALGLLLAIFLWGGNNTGTKYIVHTWPPAWTGATRFICAGLLLLVILRWTTWLGIPKRIEPGVRWQLWWRGGLSLAIYIVVFNWALRCTSASHVALYLGASPVWALVWEGRPARTWGNVRRYVAALLALGGVFILFRPALGHGGGNRLGEVLGFSASVLWTHYGRQCRVLGATLSGVEASAHTMWRAGVLLLPLGIAEAIRTGAPVRPDLVAIQAYCILAGGVVAFAIWNHALGCWPTSQVLLFNNLIPLSTMTWARICLGEPVTPTFWWAMALIVSGVVLGQTDWQKLLPSAPAPE